MNRDLIAAAGLAPEVSAKAVDMLDKLHANGYQDIAAHGDVRPGARIRHVGDRWSGAYDNGTGVVLVVTEKPNSAWSKSWNAPDVELIALWDRPNTRGWLSGLAQYHVEVIGGTA